MNLESKLRDRNLKWNWDKIAQELINDRDKIPELVQFAIKGDKIIQQNASAVLGKLSDLDNQILEVYFPFLVKNLHRNPLDAYKRNLMRTFQKARIPEELEGELFEFSIKYLKSMEEAIAVKAFSMTVARRVAERYPELAEEVLHCITIIVDEKLSPGILSRGRKEIATLMNLME